MSERKLHILVSPVFVISLLLLLFNDFVFKAQFHNQFTGKLSDFAGLFAFSLFWIAFFPRRKTFICASTAVLFVLWKSTYSQLVIDGWNSLPFFEIGRTVDYSDLWALLVVPLSYLYVDSSPEIHVPRRLIYVIAVVSVFAFTATSYNQNLSYNNRYEFQLTKKELLDRMARLPKEDVNEVWFWDADTFEISFDYCDSAVVTVEERDRQSSILLTRMHSSCPTKVDQEEFRKFFEKEFIDRLRETSVTKSLKVTRIWAYRPETPSPSPTPSGKSSPSNKPRRTHN